MISALLCLLATGATQYAQAADDWNGCYAGVHGGYGSARIGGVDILVNNAIGSATADGAVIGGQAGCDRQSENWVMGVQLSAGKGFLSGSHPYSLGSGPSNLVSYKVDYLASLAGRVGYAFQPQTLAYLKVGGAMTGTKHNDTDPAPLFGVPYTGNTTATRSGWLVGLGLERKIGSDLSGFVEFNHMDFGSKNVTIAYSDGVIATYTFRQKMSYLGLGVNYRF
jgi:outer membrane immunogenic protein